MVTVEEASSAAVEKQPDTGRYKSVIEKPSSDVVYRNEQVERAGALDRMFEGKDELPQPLLDDIQDDSFFAKGRERQKEGEVKNLIPDRYFENERKEVGELLNSLREGKSLEEIVEESWADKKKQVALKLVGARLLQEHHPDEKKGVGWKDLKEGEKRTIRMAEMMVHAAEMGAVNRRLKDKESPLPIGKAQVFERNFSRYAKSVDLPDERRKEYEAMAKRLRVANTVVVDTTMLDKRNGRAVDGAVIDSTEAIVTDSMGEDTGDSESVLEGEKPDVSTGFDTEVGMGAGDTVVEDHPIEAETVEEKKTGERSVKEIEKDMRGVREQILSETEGSGALSERVRVRRQSEIDGLRQRWQELRDEIRTRAAKEKLQGVTIEWLEKVEKELGGDVKISPEEALDWAEEHDREEKGRVEREKKKRKAAPLVKRGKKLKPLRGKKKS